MLEHFRLKHKERCTRNGKVHSCTTRGNQTIACEGQRLQKGQAHREEQIESDVSRHQVFVAAINKFADTHRNGMVKTVIMPTLSISGWVSQCGDKVKGEKI